MDNCEKAGLRAMMKLAARRGVSVTEIESEISRAIDAAWASPDPAAAAAQRELFPMGKPSPAAFIVRVGGALADL